LRELGIRGWLLAAAALALGPAWTSSQADSLFGRKDEGKVVMLFVDLTESVKGTDIDRIYTPTLRALADTLKPGDRFVLAEISEKSLGSFTAALDVSFPSSGRALDDNDALEAGRLRIRSEWRQLVSRRTRARATVILDALSAASQVLVRDPRPQKWLVLLSDMIEESQAANFAKSPPTPATSAAVIEQRRVKGLLPDLSGVDVYVAGAAAARSDSYVQVQDFWLKYVTAAGGRINEKTYGRVALRFERP